MQGRFVARGVLSGNRPASRALLTGLALAAAIVAVYASSLRGDFLWDDDLHISANETIVGPLGLKEIWTSSRALYFPLTLTNFWVQHALWGLEPFGYRVVTLFFHASAALLLWRVLHALKVPGAWLGAALWALHPVQVESVAWICELKNTQSAFFFLAAILTWTRWLETTRPPSASSGRGAYVATLGLAVLAILSKPSTVMLPVVLGLCTWWQRGRIDWRDALRLVPFFGLSALAAGWTIWEQKFNSGAIGEAWNQSLAERFAIAGRIIWFYLGKLLWPESLSFIYPRWQIDGTNPWVYAGVFAATVVAVVLWLGRNGRLRPLFFGGGYFVALLFPVLGFFSVYFFRYSFVGDHFQYLASMGPLALVGAGLARLPGKLGTLAGGVVVAGLALLTTSHTGAYLSQEALWRDTLAKNPAADMAWFNLSDVLSRDGRHEEAITAIERGLALRPDDPFAFNDLGNEYVLLGRPAEAVAFFERSLQIAPNHPSAHNNFGNALSDLGRFEQALHHLQRAVEIEPDNADYLNNLGVALAKAGRPEEGLTTLERAHTLRPDDAATHDNLAGALRALGRTDDALKHHAEALRLRPDWPEALANQGRTWRVAGNPEAALGPLERALALKPALGVARAQYAYALAELNRPNDALAELWRATELEPTSAEAHLNYGSLLAQVGRLEQAVAAFETAIALSPAAAGAYENLGNALAALQRWPEAVAQFETAVRLQPDSTRARTQLAISLVNAGRLADAVPQFEAALQQAPDSEELHRNLAQVFRALGRTRDALRHLDEATRLQLRR